MNCLKKFLVLAMLSMAMVTSLTATPEVDLSNDGDDPDSDLPLAADKRETGTSLRGPSRFLRSYRSHLTCNNYPRVCRIKGSPGPDCCRRRCVNVMKDRFNCGRCGKRCKYSEMCCKGKCVNVMTNKKHCGKCNNKCKKGSSCTYGMCSYA